MNEVICINDLTFQVKRSSRRKTIGVSVERDASLVVHIPQGADICQVRKLVEKKIIWVHRKLDAQKSNRNKEVFRRPEFVDGEGFYFLGKHYRLKLIDVAPNASLVPAVCFKGDWLYFRREQTAIGERRIAEYYTRAAHLYLNEPVNKWKKIVGVMPARYIQVMDLGFRWASCNSNGKLNFHWRVMQLPPRIIDYLIVHELVHLRIPNHTPAFWREVCRVLPDFEVHRNWLQKKGGEL